MRAAASLVLLVQAGFASSATTAKGEANLQLITDVTAPAGGRAEALVHFTGSPTFPVSLHLVPVACSEPGACVPAVRSVDVAAPSPIKLLLTCDGKGEGVATWRTFMRDADGAEPVAL